MKIRQLAPQEKDQAQKLAWEAFLNTDGLGLDEQGMHAVFDFLENQGRTLNYLASFEEQEMTGVLGYDDEDHLALCFVLPQYRNQGIGHALLQELIRDAEQRHVSRITVNSAPKARKIYEDFGFEVCGEPISAQGLTTIPMEYLLGKQLLGRQVTVTIERPCGSLHEQFDDTVYPCNYGYVEEILQEDGAFQDAYVVGPEEPLETFTGVVAAIIYHADDSVSRLVVTRDGSYDRQAVINAIGFNEQYHEVRILWRNG